MTNYNLYPKGSEWRKWDLHVHTPSSILNNEFGTDWDSYVQQLFRKAIAHSIAVIGITDYFTIDGYKKIKCEYLADDIKMQELFEPDELVKIRSILVLPNVEFRLNKLVGSNRINFHVIFSDEVDVINIEENFLHELDFIYEAGPQSEDEKRKLKVRNLEALGNKLIGEHEKFKGQSPIFTGMMNAVVDDSQIVSLLANKKNLFGEQYFIALPCDEDLSKVSWDAQDHQARKLLIQKADMMMTSNPKSIDWSLGKMYSKPEDFIAEFKSLKPCIWGSDAHTYDEIFTKNKERLLWIKADPTFEGLKQIICEPEERIRIQASKPEEKTGYQVIDKIIIKNTDILNQGIELNPNLNSIIGGRSTGKSILLGAIAMKLKSTRPIVFPDADYGTFIRTISNSIGIIWKDGQEENNREVEYFHQGYMHQVAKDEGELSRLIQEILNQKGKEEILISYQTAIAENATHISTTIANFFQILKTKEEKQQKVADKGDKKGIEDEITRLEDELRKLNIITITTEDKQAYETIKSAVSIDEQLISTLLQDVQLLKSIKEIPLMRESIAFEITPLSIQAKEKVNSIFELMKKQTLGQWASDLDKINDDILQQVGRMEKGKTDKLNDELYIRISSAYKDNDQLSELENKITLQKQKLFEITSLIAEIEELEKQATQQYTAIQNGQKEFFLKLLAIMPQLSDSQEGLHIKAKPKFDQRQYQDILYAGINQQSYANQALVNFQFTNNEAFKNHIFDVLKKLVGNEVNLKGSHTAQTMITRLLSTNFYTLTYDLEYEGDDFKKMSDGKKAFVILKLLLDFSNKECPILIDQPEDDLDNRSIYNDLVQYLRKKKKLRQIIVATHNANIVVGADSELAICANQHGDKNENIGGKKFQYVGGSLEHAFAKIEGRNDVLECQGIREHVCEMLEGGNIAFKLRERKYAIKA